MPTCVLHSTTRRRQVWDIAGGEPFFVVNSAYYRRADGIFFMLDLTDRASAASLLQRVEHMAQLPCFKERGHDPLRYPAALVVGTKSDLTPNEHAAGVPRQPGRLDAAEARVVSAVEGADLARKISTMLGRRVRYVECSAKTGCGVEKAGYALCDAAMQLRAERSSCGWEQRRNAAVRIDAEPMGRTGAFLEGTHGHTRGMKWGAVFEKGCCVQ